MTSRGTGFIVLATFVTSLAAVSVARAQQVSLGEIALKEQQRRKDVKTKSKVLSNADLPKISSAPTPKTLPEGTAAAKPETPEQAKPKSPEDEKDEAWWRSRMSQLRDELRRSEIFVEALQTRINSLTNDFASRDDPYQRARIAEDRQKALSEMDRVKNEIESHKKKLGDLEEEARRAGVPPGWLR